MDLNSQAERLSHLGEYYFSKKLDAIREMVASGRSIINLGIGSPDLPPPPQVTAALKSALSNEKIHGYPPYSGTLEFRSALSRWYLDLYGVRADAKKNILPLLGSKEGIFYLFMAYLNAGDEVLLPNPGYPAYATACRLAGGLPRFYDLKAEGGWEPDLGLLEKMDLSRVKIFVANYPHMPTGQRARPELFKKIKEFCERHQIIFVHDNPYSDVLNPERPLSALEFDPDFAVTVELNSLSKSHNMAGWRVGSLIGHADVISSVLKVKSNVDTGQFLALQQGAIEALNTSRDWHRERNKIYSERREIVFRIFDRIGFSYRADQVGLFVWAEAPAELPSVEQFLDDILEKAGVFITPGMIFGTQGTRFARSSLCVDKENLLEALRRIESLF